MDVQSVIARRVTVAGGQFEPGHLGELTQVIDFALVDAVLEEQAVIVEHEPETKPERQMKTDEKIAIETEKSEKKERKKQP